MYCGEAEQKYDEYKEQGIEMVGLAMNDKPETVKNFAASHDMNWIMLMGDYEVAGDYGGITGVPTTIFIDKKLKGKGKKEAIEHEKVHMEQMAQGRLQYNDNEVTWKPDTKTAARVYKRDNGFLIPEDGGKPIQEGGKCEWEDEAYAIHEKK